jgi:hypothetical protein
VGIVSRFAKPHRGQVITDSVSIALIEPYPRMSCPSTMADNTPAVQPLKNEMPDIHWRSAVLAGIIAGVVASVAQVALWWASSEPQAAMLFRDARLTAAIVMGREVLPPPATFDGSVMLVAALVHFALSIAYGLTLSVFVARLSTPLSLLAGGAFGLFLYAINMYGFTFLFPSFVVTRGWITAAAHVVFGTVAAMVYKMGPLPKNKCPASE